MSANYGEKFKELAEAIRSLEIFPQVIKEFKAFLDQRYLRKHELSELTWVHHLCHTYGDSCILYPEFIKRVVATQFLAKLFQASEEERGGLIRELKANINSANGRLDRFLGKTARVEIESKLETELAKMETIQKKKDKTTKYAMKLCEWLKGEIMQETGEVFANFLGPLWEKVIENASMALKSEYEHEALKEAVAKLEVALPKMEESLDGNRRALRGVDLVLVVFMDMWDKGEHDELAREGRALFTLQDDINNACDLIIKITENITDD